MTCIYCDDAARREQRLLGDAAGWQRQPAANDVTIEHVPTNLFAEPAPADLVAVPACVACKRSFQRDDRYFRAAMRVVAGENAGTRLWRDDVVAGSPRSKRPLAADIRDSVHTMMLRTPETRYLDDAWNWIMKWERARVNWVVDRLVTALHWHHYERLPKPHVYFSIRLVPEARRPGLIERLTAELLGGRPMHTAGSGMLRYAFDRADDDPDAQAWLLTLYEGVAFLIMLMPVRQAVEPGGRIEDF